MAFGIQVGFSEPSHNGEDFFLLFCEIKAMYDFLQYISISPILQWLASGMSNQERLVDFPSFKEEHIRAALAFAAHREMLTKLSAA